jgi:translocator protein
MVILTSVKVLQLLVSVGITFLASAIGSTATMNNISTWYSGLDKPFFTPPNWLFGPVWTILYLLIGVSLYLVWTARSDRSKVLAYAAYAVQLVLNTAWSIVFFGLHQVWGGLVVIGALITVTLYMLVQFRKHAPLTTWLLIPYVAWISFAACLNLGIALLN